jgi:hypothetical protein
MHIHNNNNREENKSSDSGEDESDLAFLGEWS